MTLAGANGILWDMQWTERAKKVELTSGQRIHNNQFMKKKKKTKKTNALQKQCFTMISFFQVFTI